LEQKETPVLKETREPRDKWVHKVFKVPRGQRVLKAIRAKPVRMAKRAQLARKEQQEQKETLESKDPPVSLVKLVPPVLRVFAATQEIPVCKEPRVKQELEAARVLKETRETWETRAQPARKEQLE
jgi:hypothetical protein